MGAEHKRAGSPAAMLFGVLVEDRGPARHLVFDRPERRNALSRELVRELEAALCEAEGDPGVRCIVLRGAGSAFSAGIDLEALAELRTPHGLEAVRREFALAANRLEDVALPTIAAVHGACLGAAFELALACDLRVVGADARMGLPETRIGVVPDVGGCVRLASIVGLGIAKELILTSATIDAARADRLGLATRVVAVEELDGAVDALVEELAAGSALAQGLAKRVMDSSAKPSLFPALQHELVAQHVLIGTDRFREGADAFERAVRGGERPFALD